MFRRQIAVFGIPLRQTLALQISRHTVRDGVGELCELSAGRCFYPTKPGDACAISTFDMNTKVVIQIRPIA
jgi:hypothetical protein